MEEIDLVTPIPGQISRHQCAELEVILYPHPDYICHIIAWTVTFFVLVHEFEIILQSWI